jgi:DNA (cytosine-5)-methyltransferase 1
MKAINKTKNLKIKTNFEVKNNLPFSQINFNNSSQLQFQFNTDIHQKFNANKSTKFSFIDLFAGIGGIRIALENAGFECVFSNDFDKNCKVTFDYNFANKNSSINQNHELFLSDISKIQNQQIPACDILAGGFPCQPFSIAGYRQ